MIEALHFVLVLASFIFGPTNVEPDAKSHQRICQAISDVTSSNSAVYYPGSEGYANDTHHWGLTNTQASACTVEPGNPRDVGKILQILGKSRTPFAIKSGGHHANPSFSSTSGVHIALSRFNEVRYDPLTETVEFGSGLRFNDVYNALAPYNRSVAGPRVSGVGVGGFLLGGGYSWKTNQHGLGFESVVAYELVKLDGQVVKVTEKSDAQLFFGLKGGFNNFGVVTRFTMKVLYQPAVWATTVFYPGSAMSDVSAAIVKFSTDNKDGKANMTPAFISMNGTIVVMQTLFYDGPSPPVGIFDDFFTIPSMFSNVHKGSFAEFITSNSADAIGGIRVAFHTVPLLRHSPKIMAAVQNETTFWSTALFPKVMNFGHLFEPFLPSILSHNGTPTAYPPTRDLVYFPFCLYAGWVDEAYDNDAYDAIRQSAARIRDVAIQDGQDIANAPLYPNYAIFDTPLSDMYGGNVDKLRWLRRRVDPHNVMGLSGGWRF